MLRKKRARYASTLLEAGRRRLRRVPRLPRARLSTFRVNVKDLRWRCDPAVFPFKTTADLEPGRRILGQEKALRALTLGIQMESPGYNLFVCGFPGTGRATAIRHVLASYRRRDYRPTDLLYVPSSGAPERPRLLALPAGDGERFRSDLSRLLARAGRFGPGPLDPVRRRERRTLVEAGLAEIAKRYPRPEVAAHLAELSRTILERDGRPSWDELGANLISPPRRRTPPVVMPAAITYGTLFGFIERRPASEQGGPAPHARVRAGA